MQRLRLNQVSWSLTWDFLGVRSLPSNPGWLMASPGGAFVVRATALPTECYSAAHIPRGATLPACQMRKAGQDHRVSLGTWKSQGAGA